MRQCQTALYQAYQAREWGTSPTPSIVYHTEYLGVNLCIFCYKLEAMPENSSDNPEILSDNPIKSKSGDILNRSKFAEEIGKTISRYKSKDSLVIGIYGKWGDGKTSVINMILNTIKKEAKNKEAKKELSTTGGDKSSGLKRSLPWSTKPVEEDKFSPIIVHFRPWYFSGQKKLFEQFFTLLAFKIKSSLNESSQHEDGKKIVEALMLLNKVLMPAAYMASWSSGIPLEFLEKTTKNFKKAMKNMTSDLSDSKNEKTFDPEKVKKEISDELKKLTKKIIIVIDDIDRLTKNEIRQIFQLVKSVADFYNTVYLLSFDKDIVCEALKESQAGDTEKYLEKIIQVPFGLPNIGLSFLSEYLTNHLNKIISEDGNEQSQEYWNRIYWRYISLYFTNIREINRFLNLFQFEYSRLRGEVNSVDLIAITAIKSQDSKLYQFIYDNKAMFIGPSLEDYQPEPILLPHENEGGFEKDTKPLQENYNQIRDSFGKIKIIESVLEQIFPYFKKLRGHSHLSFDYDKNLLKRDQRIADPDHFERIYRQYVPEEQISNAKLQRIIALQNDSTAFAEIIKKYDYENKKRLMDLFSVHFDQFKDENIMSVAEALAPIGSNIDEKKELVNLSPYFSLQIRFFIERLFQRGNATPQTIFERYKKLFDKENMDPYILRLFIWDIANMMEAYDTQKGRILRDKIDQSDFGDEFFKLEGIMIEKIKALDRNKKLQKHHKMIELLFGWKEKHPHEPKAFVERLLQKNEGVVDFITAALYYSAINGKLTPNVNQSSIDPFTNEDELVDKVRRIKSESYDKLSAESKMAIDALLERQK